jgi:hypothetical protein
LRSSHFYIENIIYVFHETNHLNEEVNSTKLFPLVRVPLPFFPDFFCRTNIKLMQKCDKQLIFYRQAICFSSAVVINVDMSIIAFLFKNCFYFFCRQWFITPFLNPTPYIMLKIIAYSLMVRLILKVHYVFCHNSFIHCPCLQVSYI